MPSLVGIRVQVLAQLRGADLNDHQVLIAPVFPTVAVVHRGVELLIGSVLYNIGNADRDAGLDVFHGIYTVIVRRKHPSVRKNRSVLEGKALRGGDGEAVAAACLHGALASRCGRHGVHI